MAWPGLAALVLLWACDATEVRWRVTEGRAVAKVWELDLSPGASTWLQGLPTTDGFFNIESPHNDTPDPNYPYAYQNEGVKYSASVGPAGVPGLIGDPLYGFLGFSWHNIAWIEWKFGPLTDGYWNAYKGRYRAIHYFDSSVNEGDSNYTVAVLCAGTLGDESFRVELNSDDGNTWVFEVDGHSSDPIPLATFENKYVEYDVRWRHSSDGSSADGFLTVRMRTSTDLSTWTDSVVVLNLQNYALIGFFDDDPQVILGLSMPLGFYGFPGGAVLAEIYDDDFVLPAPGTFEAPVDVSEPCCGSGSDGAPTQGQTGEIPKVNPHAPFNPGPSATTCVGGGTVPTASDLTDPENWRTLLGATPNVLCELHATKHPESLGETVYRWADQGLDLPKDSAHVEGRVRRGGWSEIRRAMALPDQYPEISRAGVVIDEQDALIRTLLDGESTAYLRAREWTQWLVSEARRKASGTMMALFRGVVAALNPGPGRTYHIEVEDHITSPFGVFDLDKLVPQAVIDHEFFGPGGDDGGAYAVGPPVSATPAPTLIGAAWRGAVFDDNVWAFGRGNMPAGSPAPPDTVTPSVTGGGDIPAGPYRVQVWAVKDGVEGDPFEFKPNGVPVNVSSDDSCVEVDWTFAGSDPDFWRIAIADFFFRARWGAGHILEVAGSARTCTFTSYKPATPGSTDAFDNSPPRGYRVVALMPDGITLPTPTGLSTSGPYRRPAHVTWLPVAGALSYYVYGTQVVNAQNKDFNMRWSVPADQIDSDGYVFFDDDWLGTGMTTVNGIPVSDLLAGQLLRGAHKDLIGTPLPILGGPCTDRGATAGDGQSAEKGAVPLIWTRDVHLPGYGEEIFGELLACIGEVAGVEDVFASDLGYDGDEPADPARAPKRINVNHLVGQDLVAPWDEETWPFPTPYRERTVNGKTLRYTAVYLRGSRMEQHREGIITATANVCGPMGVNGQMIDQVGPFLQWFYNEHVAKNQGQGYRSGEYHTLETYASDATVPYLQTSTFEAFQEYTKLKLKNTVGYRVVNFQLRERITLRELERRFMQDFEISLPFNRHGQKMVAWIDDTASVDSGTLYRERIEIDEPMPPYVDEPDSVENEVRVQLGRDHDTQTWQREPIVLRDESSISAHRGVFSAGRRLANGEPAAPIEVLSTSDEGTVRSAYGRRLVRKRKAARKQAVPTDLQALHDEIGTQIRLAHSRGVGASGYQARPFFVLGQRVDPNRKRVTLGAIDINPIVFAMAPELTDKTTEDGFVLRDKSSFEPPPVGPYQLR